MSETDPNGRLAELETENKRLRRLLDQRGVPSTLRHQVRNTLGMMRAILRRSAVSKSTVEDFAAHLEGRFDALLRVQTMLISSPQEDADLHALISNELLAHAVQEGSGASLDGPAVRLPPRAAELMGLFVHELATNALKFGALTVAAGRIAIAWTVAQEPTPRLILTWEESGLEHLPPQPPVRGFGMEAIEAVLPYQLKAESELDLRPQGLHCTIRLPLPPDGRPG